MKFFNWGPSYFSFTPLRVLVLTVACTAAVAALVNPVGARSVMVGFLMVPSTVAISLMEEILDPERPRLSVSAPNLFFLSGVPFGEAESRVVMPEIPRAMDITYTPNASATEAVGSIAPITSMFERPQSERGEVPTRIEIPDADVLSSISNPDSTDLDVLDRALLKGAVRYPTTSLLGVSGTMLVFGHSSYKPAIKNPAFRTFDGIENLSRGAPVYLYSATAQYEYAVRDIREANVENANESTIPLPNDGSYLVIVTCNTFKSISDRFVLTADYVGTRSLVK